MSGSSTGWRTEALLVAGILLLLAIIGDLAGRYELGATAQMVTTLTGVGVNILGIFTARAREGAKRSAQAVAGGRAGA